MSADDLDVTKVKDATSALDPVQRARVAALKAARDVLAVMRIAGSSAAVALDLVNVAQWIMDGRDPWDVRQAKIQAEAPQPSASETEQPELYAEPL